MIDTYKNGWKYLSRFYNFSKKIKRGSISFFFFFFFDLRGCPGQLARTTTNLTAHWTPCKPSKHVRHRGGDRRAHEDSNQERQEETSPSYRRARPSVLFFIIIFFSLTWVSGPACAHLD
jgi:hypothetical protein